LILHPTPTDVLQEVFGFAYFRPGQADVIEHVLAGRSAAAVFPTGSGKSLCYQLPALMLSGLTLVVSPLIALMKDQVDQLKTRGVAAERLDSSLTAEEIGALMAALWRGHVKLLYVAPERFNNERFREALQQLRVSLFAVDEAHCISEWGHNFRPDYLKLANFAKTCRAERMLALTATATPQVLADICRGFDIAPACAVRTGFYRQNLTVLTTSIDVTNRDAVLCERLAHRPRGPTIIYVTLQRTAEAVAATLAAAGYEVRAYHAGMADEARTATQEWFMQADNGVVVATIAFGMGIDKANIRYVYHYNLPKSLENFSQEIGRAGRDGLPSTCEMFVCPEDLNALENFAYGDTPGLLSVQTFLNEIFTLGDNFDVSLYDLSARHDIRQLVVRTLLIYLELDGYLEEGTPFYARYQFRPLIPSGDILAHFAGERREFLATLFGCAEKARTWLHLDLERAIQTTGVPRERIVRALDYLAAQQWLEVKVEGVRNRFCRLRLPSDLNAVAATLHTRTLDREGRELARLHQVLELVTHDGCQVARLCAHFGEVLPAPCGHCTWCLSNHSPLCLLHRPTVAIDDTLWHQATLLRREQPDPLADPRALARFLCGLTSPKLTRRRLTAHQLFGALVHVPFATVLQCATHDQ
jgi:ATP-dependent DNA helicase RecQ